MEQESHDQADTSASEIPYIDRIVGPHSEDDEDEDCVPADVSEGEDEFDYDSDETVTCVWGRDEEMHVELGSANLNSGPGPTSLHQDETGEALSWRMDPALSFSDWTVKIRTVKCGEPSEQIYHVHRSVLAVGPRKSGYFETVLRDSHFRESSSSESIINLSEQEGKVFDTFLDYVYSSDRFEITSGNALELRSLAKYFIVPGLLKAVDNFIKKDMYTLENMDRYLHEFSDSEGEDAREMLSHAGLVCIQKILSIDKASPLLYAMPPAFFLHVILAATDSFTIGRSRMCRQIGEKPQKVADHSGALVASYIAHHKESLIENYFETFTDALSRVKDKNVALDLLKIIKNNNWSKHLRILERNWVNALSEHFLSNHDPVTEDILESLTPWATAHLMTTAFGKARMRKVVRRHAEQGRPQVF